MKLVEYLRAQGITNELLMTLVEYRNTNKATDKELGIPAPHPRLTLPHTMYDGSSILRTALSALLAGKHLLLVGDKGSGKNVLAETLALILARPLYEAPGHVYADAGALLGEKTLDAGSVRFESGPVTQGMEQGGIVVLDEVNMMRPECLAVLHSVTDKRNRVDVAGYKLVKAHPAFRVIGTMNIGYAGTQELNEAMVDRFVVLHVPAMTDKELHKFILSKYDGVDNDVASYIVASYMDIRAKAVHGEITTKTVTIRGLLDALDLVKMGMELHQALRVCIVNKSMEEHEQKVVQDIINTRIKPGMLAFRPPAVVVTGDEIKVDMGAKPTKSKRRVAVDA